MSEFGAPIPNINGWMSEDNQANFIEALLFQLYLHKDKIYAINYWTLSDSSTALLNRDGTLRKVVEIMKNYYIPGLIDGTVTNTAGERLPNISIKTTDGANSVTTDKQGDYILILPAGTSDIALIDDDYQAVFQTVTIGRGDRITMNFVLEPKKMDIIYKIKLKLQSLQKKRSSLKR